MAEPLTQKNKRESNHTLNYDSVELKSIESLGFVRSKLTKARRTEPIQQLECLSSPIDCQNADIEFVHCRNLAFLTEGNSVYWDCKASLPENYEIHSTQVDCEGYDFSGDNTVLKGSCGLKYHVRSTLHRKDSRRHGPYDELVKHGFMAVWLSVAFYIIYKMLQGFFARERNSHNRTDSTQPRRSPSPTEQMHSNENHSESSPAYSEVVGESGLRQRSHHQSIQQNSLDQPQNLALDNGSSPSTETHRIERGSVCSSQLPNITSRSSTRTSHFSSTSQAHSEGRYNSNAVHQTVNIQTSPNIHIPAYMPTSQSPPPSRVFASSSSYGVSEAKRTQTFISTTSTR